MMRNTEADKKIQRYVEDPIGKNVRWWLKEGIRLGWILW